jgi:2-iminobutanoate/2-iminopropanoate deaminase
VKQTVFSPNAPAPVGPYRQGVAVGAMVFCSGQIALDPATGKLAGDDIEVQAHQALENLGQVLRSAGLSYGDVVKTTIFLVDMNDFSRVNGIYGQYFGQSAPARSTVGVASLPLGAKIEIEAIAVRSPS